MGRILCAPDRHEKNPFECDSLLICKNNKTRKITINPSNFQYFRYYYSRDLHRIVCDSQKMGRYAINKLRTPYQRTQPTDQIPIMQRASARRRRGYSTLTSDSHRSRTLAITGSPSTPHPHPVSDQTRLLSTMGGPSSAHIDLAPYNSAAKHFPGI